MAKLVTEEALSTYTAKSVKKMTETAETVVNGDINPKTINGTVGTDFLKNWRKDSKNIEDLDTLYNNCGILDFRFYTINVLHQSASISETVSIERGTAISFGQYILLLSDWGVYIGEAYQGKFSTTSFYPVYTDNSSTGGIYPTSIWGVQPSRYMLNYTKEGEQPFTSLNDIPSDTGIYPIGGCSISLSDGSEIQVSGAFVSFGYATGITPQLIFQNSPNKVYIKFDTYSNVWYELFDSSSSSQVAPIHGRFSKPTTGPKYLYEMGVNASTVLAWYSATGTIIPAETWVIYCDQVSEIPVGATIDYIAYT